MFSRDEEHETNRARIISPVDQGRIQNFLDELHNAFPEAFLLGERRRDQDRAEQLMSSDEVTV
jgi:hypothetical protein